MMKSRALMTMIFGVVSCTLAPRTAIAQAMPIPYGQGISVETARKVAKAALAESKKNGWFVSVAIVDTAGDLVYFERMDNAMSASAVVSQEKARTAARFKRPTKAFEDVLAGGRQAILGLPGVTPVEGGIPLIIDGKIVGAVGVNGGTSPQDSQCAQVGADTLGKAPALPPKK
jgi:uncharacterized protein GlcG (DUF336 family)